MNAFLLQYLPIVFFFAIAGALGGLSGLMVGMYYNHIDTAMSFQATLKGSWICARGAPGSDSALINSPSSDSRLTFSTFCRSR